MNEDNSYLVFVERLTEQPNSNGMYLYDFFFSETPEIVWGVDWDQQCPAACDIENLRPEKTTYNEIKRLSTIIPFTTAEDNSCFSMQDMVDGIFVCAWEDISEYEDYPEPFRLIFKFGEDFNSVEDKLAQRHQFFSDMKITKEEKDEE